MDQQDRDLTQRIAVLAVAGAFGILFAAIVLGLAIHIVRALGGF